jgi:hypothetical protein
MLEDLQNMLRVPGQTLIFCDDTDIQKRPVRTLEPDLRILVALQIDSAKYPAIEAALFAKLKDTGVSEFHATDIATGNGPWSGCSMERREAVLQFLANIVAADVSRVGAVWLPQHQFPELKSRAELLGKVSVGFRHGLKRVFVRSIVEGLALGSKPAMLVMDQDKAISSPQLEIWPEATFLIGGGPIAAPSHLVPGLQLADLVAWSVHRFLTKRAAFDYGTATPIERVAMRVVAAIPGGLQNLLKRDTVSDWAP